MTILQFASPRASEPAPAAVEEDIVAQLVFGGCAFHQESAWPRMWIQGDVCPGDTLSGIQTIRRPGVHLRRIVLDGRVVGTTWSDADADICLLAGVLPTDAGADPGLQTRSTFEALEAGLAQAGMDFSHVVRTWFYLDHLLGWYDTFNDVRTAFFRERGLLDRLIPASTGIGGANPSGSALTAGALAIRPRHGGVRVQAVGSPLQNPATAYHSSFSRAVEVAFPDRRWLTISGTASIDPEGRTVHEGDAAAQIHLTLNVVEGLLRSRGMAWSNTVRAIAYFRDIQDLPRFEAICAERAIPAFPLVVAHATVCRRDLLFELELDAQTSAPVSAL